MLREEFFFAACNQPQPAEQHPPQYQSQIVTRSFKQGQRVSATVALLPYFHQQPASTLSTANLYMSRTASSGGYVFSDAEFYVIRPEASRLRLRLSREPVDIHAFFWYPVLVASACIMYRWSYFRMLVRMFVRSEWSEQRWSVHHA